MRQNLKTLKVKDTYNVSPPLGGFNDTDEETSVPPGMMVDVLNFEFYKSGITTRPGYAEYSVSGLPTTTPIDGIYDYKKNNGNKYLMVVSSTNIYVEGATGAFSSIKSSITADGVWNFTTIADFAIGCDGVNKPVKYDGTTCKDLEVVAPTVAPSAATGSAGSLTGNYIYKITFLSSSGAETNGSPASTMVSPSSEQVDLSNIQTGGTDVVKRYIYRTKAGGSVFYYLDVINDNTTTTYTDDTADSGLGSDIIPTTHDTPPADGKFPSVYKEHLFMVDPDWPTRLYFSHQSYPEIFNTAEGTGYYIVVGLNDGEHIIGIKPLRGTMYVFKERSTWPVVGDNFDDFKTATQPLSSSIGLYHRSMAYVDLGGGDYIVGLAKDGLFVFDGHGYKNIGYQPDVGINISKFLAGLDKNQFHTAYGYNHKPKNQYWLAVREAGVNYNNRVLVWDYRVNRVTLFDIAANGIVNWKEVLTFGSSQSDGKVHQLGGFNDDGTAMTQLAEWPWWGVGSEFKVIFERINVDAVLQGDYGPAFTAYVDGSNSAHTLSLGGGNTWGSTAWATNFDKYFVKVPLRIVGTDGVNLSGHSLKCKITHSTINQPMTINGLTPYFEQTPEYAGLDPDASGQQTMGE